MNSKDYEPVEILLIEDNPQDAEITLRALKRANLGNHVHWLKDGEEALQFLFSQGAYEARPQPRPRVMLLDIKMPKIDGIEVLKRIKADARTRAIPVVMLTSSAEESDLVRSYDLGVNSYLVKPVDFQRFSEEVARVGYYWVAMNRVPGT
ncbi:MAG TPA: response regulator [Steroidobacteraceae bacterium]